jgi:sugar lactone lactonase YvrE
VDPGGRRDPELHRDQLLVDHASENGISVGGIRAVAFDADGNLWATFSGGIQMFTPETQASDGSTAAGP